MTRKLKKHERELRGEEVEEEKLCKSSLSDGDLCGDRNQSTESFINPPS